MKTDSKTDTTGEDTGRKGFTKDGFVRADLGTSETLIGDLEVGVLWDGPLKQIGTLRMKGVTAVVATSHQEIRLPPFVDSLVVRRLQAEDSSYLELLNEQSFFGELFEALPEKNKTMLNRQYRSHPIIGNAISRSFYDGLLQSGPQECVAKASWQAERTPFWGLHENHPLCWIDTDQATCQLSTTSNPLESELAIGIITKALPKFGDAEKQIGVIAFYQDQVKHLQAQLEQTVPNYSRFIELGTVDSFQGKEFPLVILLTSRFDPNQGRVGFLALPNRVNVALSRAQRQLLIIGSVNTLLHKDGGSPPFKAFASAAGTDLHYIAP